MKLNFYESETENFCYKKMNEINAEVEGRSGISSTQSVVMSDQPTASATETIVGHPEPKPFMFRFDATLVGKPGIHLPHHQPGKDPVWTQVANTHQFIDPATENRPEQSIAIWSFSFDHICHCFALKCSTYIISCSLSTKQLRISQ